MRRQGCHHSSRHRATAPRTISVALATAIASLSVVAGLGQTPAAAKSEERAAEMWRKARISRHSPNTSAIEKIDKSRNPSWLTRKQILGSNPERLARIGRHIMIGYHFFEEVQALVEAQAIAGIFITDHNVKGRSIAEVRAEIDSLQAIRRKQGLPPLLVAADQEGGAVSRLSPPFRKQDAIGQALAGVTDTAEVAKIAKAFASEQGEQLQAIGVNLNFSPVIDLKLQPNNRDDGQTLLRLRAISDDPKIVTAVAGQYCETLATYGVMCTLKHFPGLGRVKLDTHKVTGKVRVSRDDLEAADWVPFRDLMNRPYTMTMVGHVSLDAFADKSPASYSKAVIHDLIRRDWGYAGILITDDFSMGAITKSDDGIGGAAVRALQVGVDIVLVSYSEKHLNAVMTALLRADRKGQLDQAPLATSKQRLSNTIRRYVARPSTD